MANNGKKRANKKQTVVRVIALVLVGLMLLSAVGALLNFFG